MNLKSRKISLLILSITSLIFSRTMFLSFDDPEGPNLLIVVVAAMIIYSLSLIAYLLNFSKSKKLLLAIFIQALVVTIFYFCLR